LWIFQVLYSTVENCGGVLRLHTPLRSKRAFFAAKREKNANAENEIVKRTLNGSGQMPARYDTVFEAERRIHKFLGKTLCNRESVKFKRF